MITTLVESITDIDLANDDKELKTSKLNTQKAEIGTYLRFYQTRNKQDFANFCKSITQKLIPFFRKLGADEQKAEDLTQETLLKLYNKVDKFNAENGESGFIFTIAKNINYDLYRRGSAKKRKADITYFSVIEATDKGRAFDIAEDNYESPISKLSKEEEIEILLDYLEKLSSANRDTIASIYLEGNTKAETARKLGIGKSAITQRLKKSFTLIRSNFKF